MKKHQSLNFKGGPGKGTLSPIMAGGEDGRSGSEEALSPEKNLEQLEGRAAEDQMGPMCWVLGTMV